jgi:acetyl esterase/lipase
MRNIAQQPSIITFFSPEYRLAPENPFPLD